LPGRAPTIRRNDNVIHHCLKYSLLYLDVQAAGGITAI
jgi:hypothetical protein